MADDASDERATRLAAALRENLRRRKAQTKGRVLAGKDEAVPGAGQPAATISPVAATTPSAGNPTDAAAGHIVPPAHKR